jgi:hypothetical protein
MFFYVSCNDDVDKNQKSAHNKAIVMVGNHKFYNTDQVDQY